MLITQIDDYSATIIVDDLDLGTRCPVCGVDSLDRDQGVVDLTGTTIVRQYYCEADGCAREIIAVHEDLADRLKR